MSSYNYFANSTDELTDSIQLKVGKCLMNAYVVGDHVISDDVIHNGAYKGSLGWVVIVEGIVTCVTTGQLPEKYQHLPYFNKYGGVSSYS
jgi:hypothetical protein